MTRPVGACAAMLPAPPDLREAAGLVAHVFSTPLPDALAMELRELGAWARDAARLLRRLNGK